MFHSNVDYVSQMGTIPIGKIWSFDQENFLSFYQKTKRLILRTMIKCHCAEVFFESILNVVKETNRPILEVAREMGAADTCTACVPDMLAFIERELEGQLAGNTNH